MRKSYLIVLEKERHRVFRLRDQIFLEQIFINFIFINQTPAFWCEDCFDLWEVDYYTEATKHCSYDFIFSGIGHRHVQGDYFDIFKNYMRRRRDTVIASYESSPHHQNVIKSIFKVNLEKHPEANLDAIDALLEKDEEQKVIILCNFLDRLMRDVHKKPAKKAVAINYFVWGKAHHFLQQFPESDKLLSKAADLLTNVDKITRFRILLFLIRNRIEINLPYEDKVAIFKKSYSELSVTLRKEYKKEFSSLGGL